PPREATAAAPTEPKRPAAAAGRGPSGARRRPRPTASAASRAGPVIPGMRTCRGSHAAALALAALAFHPGLSARVGRLGLRVVGVHLGGADEAVAIGVVLAKAAAVAVMRGGELGRGDADRKSTRLNS